MVYAGFKVGCKKALEVAGSDRSADTVKYINYAMFNDSKNVKNEV